MAEQWFTFEDEAWIFNWTRIKPEGGISQEKESTFSREGWKGYITAESGVRNESGQPDHNPIVECVLLSVFGTLVALFVIFQLVLYIRFCITGHHDWKWSLPYILRMRRINCRKRVRRHRNPEAPARGTDSKKVPVDTEKALPQKRWSISSKASSENSGWAHIYPDGPRGVVPCRPGFFFTTRSLGSYFRAIANSMYPSSRTPSQTNLPTDNRAESSDLPGTVFLVGQQEAKLPVSLTPSVNAKSACHTKWLQKHETRNDNRYNLSQREQRQQQHSDVLFHCENPGYESDASLALTPTDDEETTDQAEGSEGVTPLPETPPIKGNDRGRETTADRLSDDSLTSISSLSGTSGRISRSQSHGSIRYNSLRFVKDRPGIYIRNRPNSTASDHKSRRLRARANSRCNSDASELKKYIPININNGFLQPMSRSDLYKLAALERGKRERMCRMKKALELNEELYPLNIFKKNNDTVNGNTKTASKQKASGSKLVRHSSENSRLSEKNLPEAV